MPKTCVQTTLETMRGVRLTTPHLKPNLFILSLYSTRHLIELDLLDCKDELVRLHLQDCKNNMSAAIEVAEASHVNR